MVSTWKHAGETVQMMCVGAHTGAQWVVGPQHGVSWCLPHVLKSLLSLFYHHVGWMGKLSHFYLSEWSLSLFKNISQQLRAGPASS